ncbi:MAG: hypothetical protein MI685_05075, partial [Chlorobiales bacterium]|nr:hypothetical protein [Chlorobiales bacterium]
MKQISLKTFLAHFCENIRADKKFCFILGSGASRPSGIKTGGELVDIWMEELEVHYEKEELQEWFKAEKIDLSDPAAHYSKIFGKRYDLDKQTGYAFLEKLMEGKEPSCGYSILAQILSETPHNIVITPNFDSLTEDALFIYTQKKPLVVGHESLAHFIKPFTTRPLIIKIHHDLLLSPKNVSEDMETMAEGYTRQLSEIFKYYTPIVIGYGGNDGSLMGFLQKLERIEGGIFWCFKRNDGLPGKRIRDVVEKLNGCAVPVKGFDELMIQIGNRLEFDRLDKQVLTIAEKRAKIYREQIEKITKALDKDSEASTALSEIVSRGEKDWWYYALRALIEADPEKADKVYKEGIREIPDSVELLGNYASFLETVRKQHDEAEKYYQRAIEVDPKHVVSLTNYAKFLSYDCKSPAAAEKYYKRAL